MTPVQARIVAPARLEASQAASIRELVRVFSPTAVAERGRPNHHRMLKPVVVRQRLPPGTRRFHRKARPTSPEEWFALFLELLRSFVAREGHARIPPHHYEGGFALGQRVLRERALRRAGTLSPERIRRLECFPGWAWEPRQADFEKALALLRDFARRHGHLRIPAGYRPQGVRLRKWLSTLRYFRRQGRLSQQRMQALQAIPGWTWDAGELRFRQSLRLLQAFYDAHGHIRVPMGHREQGLDLQLWVRSQRILRRAGQLSPQQIRALEAFPGWSWSPFEDDFQKGYTLARRYARRHGHTRVPLHHVEDGFPLGAWVGRRRRLHRQGRVNAKRVRMLETLPGWSWDVPGDSFTDALRRLQAFARREGHASVPFFHEERGFPLGRWVAGRRDSYRKRSLSPEKVRALEAVKGWVWNPTQESFPKRLELLRRFLHRHGHCRVPSRFRMDGFCLGRWTHKLRQKYREARLSPQHRRQLEALPEWSWHTHGRSAREPRR